MQPVIVHINNGQNVLQDERRITKYIIVFLYDTNVDHNCRIAQYRKLKLMVATN